jgi:phage-related protein
MNNLRCTTRGHKTCRGEVKQSADIFRIFCFFDQGKLIILVNGFHKKTQKTPKKEIEKALKIMEECKNEK